MNETRRTFWRDMAWAAALIGGLVAMVTMSGCATRGVKVVVSSASLTSVGDINWDEYKLPIFSIVSGPRSTVWINKDYLALRRVAASGCVTNNTSALGIYTDSGSRFNSVELEFDAATEKGNANGNDSND